MFSGRSGVGLGCLCRHASILPALEVHVDLFLSWGRRWRGQILRESIRSTVHSTLSQNPQWARPPSPVVAPSQPQSSESCLGCCCVSCHQPDKRRVTQLSGGTFHQSWGGTNLTIIFVRTLKSKHPTYLSEPVESEPWFFLTHIRPEREAGVVGLQTL